jgi:hypothetical protein
MISLQTTETELRALQNAVNEARDSSRLVKVSKQALWRLLQDHYHLNGLLNNKLRKEL